MVHADCFGDARSSFRTWLFGVIRRTAASERRKSWLRGLLLMRVSVVGRKEFPCRRELERWTGNANEG
jgi:DNA-directed RNA polymerase specialized sigma24 family protein